jgi:hemerythrin-like metal-binding protein
MSDRMMMRLDSSFCCVPTVMNRDQWEANYRRRMDRREGDLLSVYHTDATEGEDTRHVLQEFERYAMYDLAREAALMEACQFELADAHREEHAKLTRDIHFHIEDYLAGQTPAAEIIRLVERWLIGHLARSDIRLGDVVKQSSPRAA